MGSRRMAYGNDYDKGAPQAQTRWRKRKVKHLILIWVIMFTMVGCEKPTMVDGKPNFEKGKDYVDYGGLSYIMFDGHEYVIWRGPDRNGITHSPKCKCLKRFK